MVTLILVLLSGAPVAQYTFDAVPVKVNSMGTISSKDCSDIPRGCTKRRREAMGNTVEVTLRINNPGGQPSVVSLKVRMTPDVARSVGTQMTVHAGVAERW